MIEDLRGERPVLDWAPEMVARFWDYESNFPERYFTFNNRAEMVRQLQRHFRGKTTIFDFGCGPRYLLGEYLDAGIEVAGLDGRPLQGGEKPSHLVANARPLARRRDLVCESTENLFHET